MEDIAFTEWPGQPVDLNSGNNPWLPAYGYHTPTDLLEKDFIGNCDGEYFLQNTYSGQFIYLETILEETSDDLRSESDIDSNESSIYWLASDFEPRSVICVDLPDETECDSDREIACPAKRRKQECFLNLPNEDNDLNSLSRSSSLLQFETLEKQCQETRSNSPSIFSQISFDSLETNNRTNNCSPDSLNSPKTVSNEDETDISRTYKITKIRNDNLFCSVMRHSGFDSSDIDVNLEPTINFVKFKTWKSLESLPANNKNKNTNEKISIENLSEDSGYGDHMPKSKNHNNLKEKSAQKEKVLHNLFLGFSAYDGDIFQEHISGNFGISYQDLTVFKQDQLDSPKSSSLIENFTENRKHRQLSKDLPSVVTKNLILEFRLEESDRSLSKFITSSCSEPNLFKTNRTESVYISSLPKDLNFISDFRNSAFSACRDSVAAKNWNLAYLEPDFFLENNNNIKQEKMEHRYVREGSYAEAMANRVDLSDDENSLYNRNRIRLPKTPIVEFDKRVLKSISEQSLQDIVSSNQDLLYNRRFVEEHFASTKISSFEKRNMASTPNLVTSNQYEPDQKHFKVERRKSAENLKRKNSTTFKSSTSTSVSDTEGKTLESIKSFSSNNSRGVHFSPVVSEVNWRDSSISTVTPDRESVDSFGSSSPERKRSPPPTKKVMKPRARLGTPVGLSNSQPELKDDECRKEFVDSLRNLREDLSKSQPDFSKLKRRGSQLIKKDKDGSVISAYVDRDGIQYKHTHLDIGMGFGHAVAASPHSSAITSNERIYTTNKQNSCAFDKPVVDLMEKSDVVFYQATHTQQNHKEKKHSGKFGGLLSRLVSFRFSLKKGEEKDKVYKKNTTGSETNPITSSTNQHVATKDDYIYIPLKGAMRDETVTKNRNTVQNSSCRQDISNEIFNTYSNLTSSSKPPLPKQTPRVVHASVKKNQHGADAEQRHRRRRTIDSSSSADGDSCLPMEPMGLIETDLDTEVTVITSGANVKTTRSLLDLGPKPRLAFTSQNQREKSNRPHKSMEFLLDKENLKVVEPPENELQKSERVISEHQLRVQRSLQKLTIPDWYKQSQVPREGFILKKQCPRETRWKGTGCKTTSLSSLTSNLQSPLILSPTPLNQPFVRWSTSKINSTASSPCASTRSSFNANHPNGQISHSSVRSSFNYRQPYLGWRSQERLNRPRTPAERLACSILGSQLHYNSCNHSSQENPEIQSSIKEVTSAIVHYVSGLRPDDIKDRSYESQETTSQKSSSGSPRGSQTFFWLESSFVGSRPLDSPQTPVTLPGNQSHNTPTSPMSLRLNLQNHNGKYIKT